MVDVCHPLCGCGKSASFGAPGSKKRTHCSSCRTAGMLNMAPRRQRTYKYITNRVDDIIKIAEGAGWPVGDQAALQFPNDPENPAEERSSESSGDSRPPPSPSSAEALQEAKSKLTTLRNSLCEPNVDPMKTLEVVKKIEGDVDHAYKKLKISCAVMDALEHMTDRVRSHVHGPLGTATPFE